MKLKIILLIALFLLTSQFAFAESNIFKELADGNVNNTIVSKLKGRISLLSISLAWALFVFTTGLSTIKKTFKAWKGGEDLNIVEFNEIMRKLSIIVFVTTFTLFSDLIIGFAGYMKKATENLTEKTYTETSEKYYDVLADYSKFAHYYKVKSQSNCETGDCDLSSDEISEAKIDLEHYYENQKKIPRAVDSWGPDMPDFRPLQISLYNMGELFSVFFNWALSSMLLGFGKFISFVMSYAFSIYLGILLALAPIPFALSIPKSLKNSYVKMLNSLITVSMAFVVLNVIDAFFLEGFDSLVTSLINENTSIETGVGNYNNLTKRNEVLFIASPLFFIVTFGLYFCSMGIASKCVGASSDDGGIASKGFSSVISTVTMIAGASMLSKGIGAKAKNMGKQANKMSKNSEN